MAEIKTSKLFTVSLVSTLVPVYVTALDFADAEKTILDNGLKSIWKIALERPDSPVLTSKAVASKIKK
jgi:hypothetical protein